MTNQSDLSRTYSELLDELRDFEQKLRTADPPLPEADLLDGYRLGFSLLRVAVDAYVWGDKANPILVDVIGPYLKWGGDNSDAYYQCMPVDPARTYRITGNRGDAVYLSMTVYGGPDDGRYSDRIVGTMNDKELIFDDAGNFEFTMSPDPQSGAWLKLEPDAVFALTRDYVTARETDRRPVWKVEAVDPPARRQDSPQDLARRLRAARTWLHDQFAMLPINVDPPNEIAEPYPVPTQTYGWAAGDAAYAMGSYELQPHQALVIEGTSPACVFWNLCLWNPFLHTYDFTHEQVTINGAQVAYEPDGSWRIVISDTDPGRPELGLHRRPIERADLAAMVPARGNPGTPAVPRRGREGFGAVTERPAAIRLTDLADPVYPETAQPLREALAGYGAMLQLDPDAMLATATERTGLADWGDPAFRERLEVLCTALRDEAGLSETGVGRGLRTVGGQPGQPTPVAGVDNCASRDRRHPDRAADHHLRSAAHRHHASAQPVGRRSGAAPPAVLGKPRTVPVSGRTRRAVPPRPVCNRTRSGRALRCPSSSACMT